MGLLRRNRRLSQARKPSFLGRGNCAQFVRKNHNPPLGSRKRSLKRAQGLTRNAKKIATPLSSAMDLSSISFGERLSPGGKYLNPNEPRDDKRKLGKRRQMGRKPSNSIAPSSIEKTTLWGCGPKYRTWFQQKGCIEVSTSSASCQQATQSTADSGCMILSNRTQPKRRPCRSPETPC
jgi:hypothetical protein